MTIDEAIKVAEAATPGPWEWWTSNSWRRLTTSYKSPAHARDGDVLCPVKSRADGHPDCSIKEVDMAHIAKFNPVTVRALLRFVQAWDAWHTGDEPAVVGESTYDRLLASRAALDEALK